MFVCVFLSYTHIGGQTNAYLYIIKYVLPRFLLRFYTRFFFYQKNFYKKMSLKKPKTLKKCLKNLQPQMAKLNFLKTLIFPRALQKLQNLIHFSFFPI